MKITGFKPQGSGVNYISDGHCCPSTTTLTLALNPGEQAKNIKDIFWTDTTCGSVISTVNFSAYASPLSPNVFLDAGTPCIIVLDLCGCGSIGDTFTAQLDVVFDFPTSGIQTFYFDFEVIDISAAPVIDVTDVNFWDCINDCGRKQDLVTINNPLDTDLVVTFPDPGAGFSFYILGSQIFPSGGTFTINVPPATTYSPWILQIANPGCAVSVDTDFSLVFSYCTQTKTVNVNHRIVECGDCDIYCDGVTISSSATIPLVANPQLTAQFSTWTYGLAYGFPAVSVPGVGPNTTPFGFFIVGDNVGYTNNEVRFYETAPVAWPNASPNAVFKWTLKTGAWDVVSSASAIYMFQPNGAFGGNIPLAGISLGLNTVEPGKTYTGTFVVPSYTPPLGGAGPLLVVQFGVTAPNQAFQILEFNVESVDLLATQNYDCSSLDPYNFTAVGDLLTAEYTFYYGKGFQVGTLLNFNTVLFGGPAPLFTQPAQQLNLPDFGYNLTIGPNTIGYGWQTIGFFPKINTPYFQQLNYYCQINILDEYEFKIKYEFYITTDVNAITGLNWPSLNRDRLIKTLTNQPDFTNTVPSVFNTIKTLKAIIFIEDPNYTVNVAGSGLQPYRCYRETSVFFSARWWNQGLNAGPSEMTNPTFLFTRNAAPVTNLSLLEDTEVEFQIDAYPGSDVSTVIFWLFNSNPQFNNVNDFVREYGYLDANGNGPTSSRAIAITQASNTIPLGSPNFTGPSQAVQLLSGTTYNAKIAITNTFTSLDPNGVYYLGAICYDSAGSVVNSFISDRLLATSAPDPSACGTMNLGMDVYWVDYNQLHNSTCHSTSPKERYRNLMFITGGAFDAKLATYGMPVGTSYLDYLESATCQVFQPWFNIPNKIVYFNYFVATQYRDTTVLGNWANNNTFGQWYLTEDGIGGLSSIFYGRTRYESYIPPQSVYWADINTPLTMNYCSPTQASNYIAQSGYSYDWINPPAGILHRYQFNFRLSWLPGSPVIAMNQVNKLYVCDYENSIPPSYTFGQLFTSMEIYGVNTIGSTLISNTVIPNTNPPQILPICSNYYNYLQVYIYGTTGIPDGTMMATIDFTPFGAAYVKEEESQIPGNPYFTQQTNVYIYDVQNMIGGVSSFKIDMAQLPVNQEIEICGIYIPL